MNVSTSAAVLVVARRIAVALRVVVPTVGMDRRAHAGRGAELGEQAVVEDIARSAGHEARRPRAAAAGGGAGIVEIVTRRAAGHKRGVGRRRKAAPALRICSTLRCAGPGIVINGVLEKAMRDIDGTAVDHADDLALAVQALVPDARGARRAGLVRAGSVDVVVLLLGHFLDAPHVRQRGDGREQLRRRTQ